MNGSQQRITRAFALGVLLLLAGAGAWFFADAHAPTLGNAVTSEWVLKPRVYDLLRFGSAALGVLGVASLLQAVLIALQSSAAPPAPAPGPAAAAVAAMPDPAPPEPAAQKPQTPASYEPPRRSHWSQLKFIALGAAIVLVGAVAFAGNDTNTAPKTEQATASDVTPAPSDTPAPEDPETVPDEGTIVGEPTTQQQAKSNARAAVSMIETCYTDTLDYRRCTTASKLGDPWFTVVASDEPLEPGDVQINAEKEGFAIVAADDQGLWFAINKDSDTGEVTRTCTAGWGEDSCDPPTW